MALAPRVIAFVMAGGEGVRLRPYTAEQPKPALPLAGPYRIIDFVLSNLYNSGVRRVFVLLQYKPEPLLAHLASQWSSADLGPGEFIEPVLPGRAGREFSGTADAVRQNLDLLEGCRADIVAVFAADHVYRMDVQQMIACHQGAAADATVAALPVPIEQAREFGVLGTRVDGRILEFREKPARPAPMPGDARFALVSMGNYLFRPEVLREALSGDARDFGRDVLPQLIDTHRVVAYDFRRNVVPGVRSDEECGYWRDVGTLDAYAAAHRDVQGARPRLALDNPEWPIRAVRRPPAERHVPVVVAGLGG
ncbi:MAG TPA: sugar phosphate nucleotidyltransferase [Ideonella sp.]|nr:sugar phosphate nucleotidyltransferase [Ideonella sp.]